ncbi:MAG: arsenic metallochaperone ArsD family protein, partial [Egibacteraceae bacterium]
MRKDVNSRIVYRRYAISPDRDVDWKAMMMVTVEVFDPAMCCSTGVCGPSVDPALARFASDLDWLGEQGAQVRRYNLGQEPGAFA